MAGIQVGKIALSNVLALAVVCQVGWVTAQQRPAEQDDVIRIKTDLVQVRAVVTDKSGKPVANLKQDDFEILENGKPQTVSFFLQESIQERAAAAADPTRPSPGNRSTETPAANAKPARTIVLFVDTLHLSLVSLIRAKERLKRFVDEQITDQDIVAVVATSGSLGVLQQFMRDRRMLKRAIDRISGFVGPASLYTPYLAARVLNEDRAALNVATQILAVEECCIESPPSEGQVRARGREILARETQFRRATLKILGAVGDQMSQLPGQRMIAFVSDGFTLLEEGGGADTVDFAAATSRAVRSGVVVNCFSPEGLVAPVEFSAASPLTGAAFGAYMADSQSDRQSTLRSLAGDTGGQAYLNSNDMVGQMKKMLDANSVYYAIGYYPQDHTDNKKYRNIKVRVKDHAEYKIRTQKGYQPLAPEKDADVAATPQKKLFQAMIAPLPVTAINVTSSANFLALADDDAQVTLQVHIAGDSLQYPKQDEKYSLKCEVAITTFDQAGKILATLAETIHTTFTAEQLEMGKQNGYRYSKRFNLAPGLHQVRIGVRDVNSGLMGTSVAWVDVPDLHNKKLALSSIFIGRDQKQDAPNPVANKAGKQAQPMLLVGTPLFKSGETAFYRFVVYNAQIENRSPPEKSLQVEILRGEKSIFRGDWQSLVSRKLREDRTGIEVGGQINLGLESGFYTLRVTVKDAKSKKTTQQSIDFEVQ